MARYIYLTNTDDLSFVERINELMALQKYDTDERPRFVSSPYVAPNILQRYDMKERKIVNINEIMSHKFLV